jgi:hypothetical protein
VDDRLLSLQRHAEQLGLTGFASAFRHGFLLHRPLADADLDPLAEDGTARFGVATKLVRRAELDFDHWEDDPLDAEPGFLIEIGHRAGNLRLDRISIGRAPGCDIVLRLLAVSKQHAELELEQKRVVRIRDCQSSNGTFVNGVRVIGDERRRVAFGDKIGFGALEFELVTATRAFAVLETL